MERALSLDEKLPETYKPLAAMEIYYHRDWPAAERAFLRGLEVWELPEVYFWLEQAI